MTRVFLMAAFGAVLAFGGTASAGHKTSHAPGAKSKATCEVKKGFVVLGVLTGDSTVTANSVEDFDVTRANRHARRAGFGNESANDPGTYTLPTGKAVKLSGYEDGEDPGAGDKVRVVGKIAFDRCREARDGDGRGYEGDPIVRRIKVIDSD